jgi:hypothetical protein
MIMLVAQCRQLPSQQVQKRGRGRPRKTEADAPRSKPLKPVWSFNLFPDVKKRRGRPPKIRAPPVFNAASAPASASFAFQFAPHVVCIVLLSMRANSCAIVFLYFVFLFRCCNFLRHSLTKQPFPKLQQQQQQ